MKFKFIVDFEPDKISLRKVGHEQFIDLYVKVYMNGDAELTHSAKERVISWCENNCLGKWKCDDFEVGFEVQRDYTLFLLFWENDK